MSSTSPVPGTELFRSGIDIAATYLGRLMPSVDSKNVKHNLRTGAFALSTLFLVASVVNVISLNILSGIVKAAIGAWLRVVSEQEIQQNPRGDTMSNLSQSVQAAWTKCLGAFGMTPDSIRIQWDNGLKIGDYYLIRT